MKISSKWIYVLLLMVISGFVYGITPYGYPDLGPNYLEDAPVPPEWGTHQLRFIVNGSENRSVDANENGIIDYAEQVIYGAANYWRRGWGWNITTQYPFYRVVLGDVGVNGSLLLDVEGDLGAARYCDENGLLCRSVEELGAGVFVGLAPPVMEVDGALMGVGGYPIANFICRDFGDGAHLCTESELINSIGRIEISTHPDWEGSAWVSTGGPKYTPSPQPVNDCNGWTSNDATLYRGSFWIFDRTTGGRGGAIHCATTKKLACCR